MAEQVTITVPHVGVRKGKVRELNFRSHLEDTTPAVGKYNRRMATLRSLEDEDFTLIVAQQSLGDLDEIVGRVLNDEGIVGTERIVYRNYARAVWSKARKYGFIKSSMLNALRDYFRSQGGTERVLKRIESIFLVPIYEARRAQTAGAAGAAGGGAAGGGGTITE